MSDIDQTGKPTFTRGKVAERPTQHAAPTAEREPQHEPAHERVRERSRTRLTTASPPTHDSYINHEAIPRDVSLEWKLFTAAGKEYPFHLQAMRKQGWEVVNPQEHPDWVNLPPGYKEATVIIDGLILMERPAHLTREAREDDRLLAKQRMREAEQRLGMTPKDTLTREHESIRPRVVKEMMRPISTNVAIEE